MIRVTVGREPTTTVTMVFDLPGVTELYVTLNRALNTWDTAPLDIKALCDGLESFLRDTNENNPSLF